MDTKKSGTIIKKGKIENRVSKNLDKTPQLVYSSNILLIRNDYSFNIFTFCLMKYIFYDNEKILIS